MAFKRNSMQLFLVSLTQSESRRKMHLLACLLLFVGLICSKFLMTVSMIMMLLVAFLNPRFKLAVIPRFTNKAHWMSFGIFGIFVYGVLMSSDLESSALCLRIALPYLVLPFAFALSPAYHKDDFPKLLSIYFWALSLCCVGVLIYFYFNYDIIQVKLRASQAVPTPNKDHIRFSLMINLAIFAAFWILEQGFCWYTKWERLLMTLATCFLVVTLHILSVRIGLVILYSGMLVSILYLVFRKRALKTGLFLLLLLVFVPQIAYKQIPSLQTKVKLSIYNWQRFQKGYIKDSKLSDVRRYISYKVAWEIAQNNPWTGVGIGDLKNEATRIYARDYPQQLVLYPHNFFLTIFAAVGLPGLIIFSICFFGPLLYQQNYQNLFFLLFYCCISLSMLTENTLLIAKGVALHCGFLMMSLHHLKKE